MNKVTVFFLMVFVLSRAGAQDYFISFTGTGAATSADSVQIENLTKGTSLMLSGGDLLHLVSTNGFSELNSSLNSDLLIFPNPMKGNCIIRFESAAEINTTFELYDLKGNRIINEQKWVSKGSHFYSLSGIGSGLYTLKIKSGIKTYTSKILSISETVGMAEFRLVGNIPEIDIQDSPLASGLMMRLKNDNSVIDMLYNTGDLLMLTGRSGHYRTVFMLVPSQSQAVEFNFIACTDADSNNYSVVEIGAQTWMAENLKVTHYRDGTPIPNVTSNSEWAVLSTAAYCWYNNDEANYKNSYGALYNWYAVADSHNICPTGWHMPRDYDWTILSTYLGANAGGKMKSTRTAPNDPQPRWEAPNTDATNESGFSGLPGGSRDDFIATFYLNGHYGNWWSKTEDSGNTLDAWSRNLYHEHGILSKDDNGKSYGFSVRCLRD
ncbi:MAG: T9SS type A sorting domain-containing protein [Bacteroidales bacterium]|nr:T9SS type A sorting domain-containing protein [Bacteroidales bacterium]